MFREDTLLCDAERAMGKLHQAIRSECIINKYEAYYDRLWR